MSKNIYIEMKIPQNRKIRTSDSKDRSTKWFGLYTTLPSRKLTNRNEEPIKHLSAQVSENNIYKRIENLSSFHTRHSKSIYINQVADWLKGTLEKFNFADVYFHDYRENSYALKNVVCQKQGSTDTAILVCAHYDCRMEDINNFRDRAPGADDNASGVSVTLEVARILSKVNLEDTIQFVFFSGEEQGQWGSRKYARYLHETDARQYHLINIDMVGRPPLNKNKVIVERDMGNKVSTNDLDSQRFGNRLARVAREYTGLKVGMSHIYDSDYMPFEALGDIAIGVYDGGENDVRHHSRYDISSALNTGYMASVARMVLITILEQAKGRATTPHNISR